MTRIDFDHLKDVLIHPSTGTVHTMRHLGSLLAGLLIAPAAWLLLAIGQPETTKVFSRWVEQDTYHTTSLLGPIAYLAGAGLLAGLIACLRLSPLGPAVAGAVYVAVYGVMFVNPLWGLDRIPKRLDLPLVTAQPRVPVTNGTLALLGLCLLVAVASRHRWRQWPVPVADPVAEAPVAQPQLAPIEPGPEPITLGQALLEASVPEPAPLEQRVPKPPVPEFTAHRDAAPPSAPDGDGADAPESEAATATHPTPDSPWSAPPRILRS